ncbi:F-box/WD repeat-containing protein 7-like isoform X2 [Protopterus annectens]|uniref:F-box/WD repeat-containing protein 7-like isoform X2 n=1 Tax=Protopterus annectens TaxID=7888 RepID=UPI001CFA28D9|nr:F-box/WD repeat-containing protein 7-like isoform X2 [Protopterus annectens]
MGWWEHTLLDSLKTEFKVMHFRDFLSQLPEQVAMKILHYLSPLDLLRASQVNKHWHALCSRNDVWFIKYKEAEFAIPKTHTVTDWKNAYRSKYCATLNWKKGKCKPLQLLGHGAMVTCLAIQEELLASGSRDKTIQIWNLPSGLHVKTLEGHRKGVWGLQFFTDNLLVSASYDTTIKIWNVRLGDCARTLYGHDGPVWSIALKEYVLVSGSQDKLVKVWDVRRCHLLHTMKGHTQAVFAVDVDSTIKQAFSGSADKSIRIWDLDTGTCLRALCPTPLTSVSSCAITSISFDGGYLACSAGNIVWLYSVTTAKCLQWFDHHKKSYKESLQTLRGASAGVTCTLCDDTRVIGASKDNSIWIWDFGIATRTL